MDPVTPVKSVPPIEARQPSGVKPIVIGRRPGPRKCGRICLVFEIICSFMWVFLSFLFLCFVN